MWPNPVLDRVPTGRLVSDSHTYVCIHATQWPAFINVCNKCIKRSSDLSAHYESPLSACSNFFVYLHWVTLSAALIHTSVHLSLSFSICGFVCVREGERESVCVLGHMLKCSDQYWESDGKKTNTKTYWQRSQSLRRQNDSWWQKIKKKREMRKEGEREEAESVTEWHNACLWHEVISVDCLFVNSTYCTLWNVCGSASRECVGFDQTTVWRR